MKNLPVIQKQFTPFLIWLGLVLPAWLWLAQAAEDKSVKPGINDNFTKTNLEVGRWVKNFESESREIFAQRNRILETVRLKPGQAVADVGAGSGLFTVLFSQAVGPEGKVYAVDIAQDFLKHIEDRAKEEGIKNIQTVRCTDRSAKLPANSVNLVFICDTYHHFEYPKDTLASLYQALRPGGELVLVEFHRVPGKSSDWLLNHVRAGQEVFTTEIEAAGFKQTEMHDFLKENYILRFKKVER
jgi:SAM-dependent methyltransferase